MRILHCIPVLDGGGAERQLCYLASGLVDLGHTVDVALLRDGDLGACLRKSGAHVHLLGWHPAFDPTLVARLAQLILRRRSEVVQTWLRRMDVAGGLAALATRRPWIYSERTLWQAGGWRQALRLRLLARSSAAVANSDHAAARLREMLGRVRTHVVPNALPLDEIAATPATARATISIPDEAELILFVGRFATEKNIDLLLETVVALLARRPRAFVWCAGKGPLLDGFRRAIDTRSDGTRVLTAGFRDDVWSLLKCADLLLSTSSWEGRPNAVLEAMACRCPLVLTDIPAHREIVSDGDALFFPAGKVGGAVAAVEKLLDDRAAAKDRAARAVERVREFSIAAVARRYAAIYQELLSARQTRRGVPFVQPRGSSASQSWG